MTREEAIKIYNTVLLFGKCDCPKEEIEECLKMAIKALEQEPRKGHWNDIPKYKDIAWQCSECGHFTTMKHNYCPNCGAKMESEE